MSISKNPSIDEKYFIKDCIFCSINPIAIGGKATTVLNKKFFKSAEQPFFSAKFNELAKSGSQPAIASRILFLKVINCIPEVITFKTG